MADRSGQARPASAWLQDGELVLQQFDFAQHPIHKVPTCFFRMVHAGTGEELGNITLRVESTPHVEKYAGHVGYGVHVNHRGHRYAARALRLLVPIARSFSLDALWITCDPENQASRRTCELAGAELIEIVDVPEYCVIYQTGHKHKCRYRLNCKAE